MSVIMPKTGQPMTIDEQNIVAALYGEGATLRREEILEHALTPATSETALAAALAALIAGDAVERADSDDRYRLTPAGQHAALFGEFGRG